MGCVRELSPRGQLLGQSALHVDQGDAVALVSRRSAGDLRQEALGPAIEIQVDALSILFLVVGHVEATMCIGDAHVPGEWLDQADLGADLMTLASDTLFVRFGIDSRSES